MAVADGSEGAKRARDRRGAAPYLVAVAILHLALAWPGAGARGVIAEEVLPYLRHYPKVLEQGRRGIEYLPPYDDAGVLAAVEAGRAVEPRWVASAVWPELAYLGRYRVFPVLVRLQQTALGTAWGLATAPLLGGGIAGVRRSSVVLGLALVLLAWGLARRLGLSRRWATVAAAACAISPGLWFFCRTGYGYELASRVLLLLALYLAAKNDAPISPRRSVAIVVAVAAAVLGRATIVTTLAPVLFLMLLHKQRYPGAARVGGIIGLGVGVPVLMVGVLLIALRDIAGAIPAAHLPLEAIPGRTLGAPAAALVQLAWVVDPRVILAPLVGGATDVGIGWVRPALGAVVLAIALWRWRRRRASEAERWFACGLAGNALLGAWLYGDPMQFQLGMALEPLFVLAVITQISELSRHHFRAAMAITVLLAGARATTLATLWSAERRTDNPMLSGAAQRALVDILHSERVRGDDLMTTTYDHAGMIEAWTNEEIRPVHAWRVLRASGPSLRAEREARPRDAAGRPHSDMVLRWPRLLDAHPVCHVLLTRAPNLVAGSFTDNPAVARALDQALAARGAQITRRRTITGNNADIPVFELLDVAPCGRRTPIPN